MNEQKKLTRTKLFFALDVLEKDTVLSLAREVCDYVDGFKIGMAFFYRYGREGYNDINKLGLPIFLDLKLHDIQNTVSLALDALATLQPEWISVHVSIGLHGLCLVQENLSETAIRIGIKKPKIVGITVLTNMNANDFQKMGIQKTPEEHALQLAQLAQKAHLEGVTCSVLELACIKQTIPSLACIVPGIRLPSETKDEVMSDDQKRTGTPKEAAQKGASIIVVGRPIIQSTDPKKTAHDIKNELL